MAIWQTFCHGRELSLRELAINGKVRGSRRLCSVFADDAGVELSSFQLLSVFERVGGLLITG